jgi:hypothetical protein
MNVFVGFSAIQNNLKNSADLATQKRRKALAALATINPKNLPKTQEDQERVKHKAERLMEKAKKRVASSRLVRELQAEMDEDRPEVVHWDDDHQQLFGKHTDNV